MLLVMWTVAPNGWIVVSLAPHGTAGGHGMNGRKDHDKAVRINAVDHAETDDHGTCSLPRHTIRERID
jgi:hypothetical protein